MKKEIRGYAVLMLNAKERGKRLAVRFWVTQGADGVTLEMEQGVRFVAPEAGMASILIIADDGVTPVWASEARPIVHLESITLEFKQPTDTGHKGKLIQ